MTWTPKGWVSFTGGGTTDAERADRICECPACRKDGQHEPMCAVHEDWEKPPACDCPKGKATPHFFETDEPLDSEEASKGTFSNRLPPPVSKRKDRT